MQAWVWLLIAICFEVAGTVSLKISNGFANLIPTIGTFFCYGISFMTLAFALKKMDISLAYAIWAGVGTAVIACIGVLYFDEPVSILKVLSLSFIILGVIGLNLVTAH
ncbi:MAG: Smr family multidrug resistance protein [Chlamydiia bacterium]|nr:Smr family multidrug resistance protein [Chlamydiia bacterium]